MSDDIPLLDSSGKLCPLPVLRLRKAMAGLTSGARLRTRTTDPMAIIDVPNYCREAGHKLLAQVPDGQATIFTIEHG